MHATPMAWDPQSSFHSTQITVSVPTPLETWKGTLKNDLALAVGLGIDWALPWWHMIDCLLPRAMLLKNGETIRLSRPLSVWNYVLGRDWGAQPALSLLPGLSCDGLLWRVFLSLVFVMLIRGQPDKANPHPTTHQSYLSLHNEHTE